jgi:predicted transcriptional regulator
MPPRPKRTEVLRARVDADLHDRVAALAEAQGRTTSDLVRHLIAQAVEREERRTKRAA